MKKCKHNYVLIHKTPKKTVYKCSICGDVISREEFLKSRKNASERVATAAEKEEQNNA